jgi:hypothetical protein
LKTHRGKVDILGVGDSLIKDVPLCTAAGLIETSGGPIIGIMHNYAAFGKGGSIHSPLQMQDIGVLIDDTAKTQKRIDGEFGTQMIRVTSGGSIFEIPLTLNGGLSYFKMTPPTQEQLADATIPQVTLTSKMPWNPSKYDADGDSTPTNEVLNSTAVVHLIVDNDGDDSSWTDDGNDSASDMSMDMFRYYDDEEITIENAPNNERSDSWSDSDVMTEAEMAEWKISMALKPKLNPNAGLFDDSDMEEDDTPNEHGKDEIVSLLTVQFAPDGECQAGNRFGPEQAVPVPGGSWHPVFHDGECLQMPKGTDPVIQMPEGTHPMTTSSNVTVG